MRIKRFALLTPILLSPLDTHLSTVFAQGSLTPPGPPAPTMKTLQQVEPRTPISALPFTISQAGSYYLTTNLSAAGGIIIASDDVSLDLNGFALVGMAGSSDGIVVAATRNNVAIRNGTVRNWGADGVDAFSAQNSQFLELRAFANGGLGLRIGPSSLVKSCLAMTNASSGISAEFGSTITDCTAFQNGSDGIIGDTGTLIANCSATQNGDDGIEGGAGSSITRCWSGSNGDDGIVSGDGSTVEGNTCRANLGDGVSLVSDSRAAGNTCDFNGFGAGIGAGIHATSSDNRIENNQLTDNDRGLEIDGAGNYVAGNTVRGNSDNYAIAAGNQINLLLGQIPQTIPWPASVLLAGTLTGISGSNGLTIAADNVTIDLGGHALLGVTGSLHGITFTSTRRNLRVRNGTVANWGGHGVDASGSHYCQFFDLTLASNGVVGLRTGTSSLVRNCAAIQNGDVGIDASTGSSVADSVASSNGDNGIDGSSCTVVDSVAANNGGMGMSVVGSTLLRNLVRGNTGHGIEVFLNCRIADNTCDGNGLIGDGAGIHLKPLGSGNRVEGNLMIDNDRGIDVESTGNLIIRNSARGNGTNYVIAPSNRYGPIIDITAAGSPAVSGNSAADTTTTTHPWANFAQ